MSRSINLIVNIPNAKDATSLYRGIGPISEMRRKDPRLSVNAVGEYSWTTFAMNDIFFMQRPFMKAHLDMVHMAKDNGCPVWVDYDDDLFSVPQSNPAYPVYSSEDTRKTIATILASADVVTVSTPFLKKQFQRGPRPLNDNIVVVPNAINTKMFGYRKPPVGARKRMIAWRGSSTHHKDLFSHLPEIVRLVNSDSSWKWMFQGDKPWFLYERLGDNAVFVDSLDPIQYFKTMHEIKPPVMMVPLHECDFNKAKSNIAWLEAAFFGGMTIAPNWDEWKRPGCVNYETNKHFGEVMVDVMQGRFDATAEAEKAWSYVMDTLQLTKVNEARFKIIEQLLDSR